MMVLKKLSRWHWLAIVMGVLIAVVSISYLNEFIIKEACLDHGGRYHAEVKTCADPLTDYQHTLEPTFFMWLGYSIFLLIIPYLLVCLVDIVLTKRATNKKE